jgi:hypothetical protein
MIRTVLVLLDSLLLSSWFSSGIGEGPCRLAAWCIIRARFLAILVKGELNG